MPTPRALLLRGAGPVGPTVLVVAGQHTPGKSGITGVKDD